MKFEDVARGYANLWARMQIRPEHLADAQAIAHKLGAPDAKARFKGVADKVSCPWWFVAIVCQLEAGGGFHGHLHNGDPLAGRTTHVPAGRPPAPLEPPFTWEQSADDALRYQGIDKITDWTIARALFTWESYNGFGYWGKINSPYVWSFSTLYTSGKIVEDHGPIDMDVISQQCGAAVILRALIDLGYVEETKGEISAMDDLKKILASMSTLVPALATAIGGPLAGVAAQAIATEVGAADAQPQSIIDKIHDLGRDVPALIAALTAANQKVAPIVQPVTPQPSTVIGAAPTGATVTTPVPVAVIAPDALPKASTGPLAFLDGYKTYIGAAICVAGFVAFYLHYITADVSNAIVAVGVGIGGVGVADRWQKLRAIVPIIPALPTTAVAP